MLAKLFDKWCMENYPSLFSEKAPECYIRATAISAFEAGFVNGVNEKYKWHFPKNGELPNIGDRVLTALIDDEQYPQVVKYTGAFCFGNEHKESKDVRCWCYIDNLKIGEHICKEF